MPGGANVVVFPPLDILLDTLQFETSGSFSFAVPAETGAVMLELPHERVTFAGEVSWTTAQR